MPLLNDKMHAPLTTFLKGLSNQLAEKPKAIICISAHYESSSSSPALTTSKSPKMLYDYGGFPQESYEIQYPAPGPDSSMVDRVSQLLSEAGIGLEKDPNRGYDHGTFVPLKLIFPQADIPVLQMSILSSMDPARHWEIGKALSPLRSEGYLIIGSGFTFHNLRPLMSILMSPNKGSLGPDRSEPEKHSIKFNDWIVDACCSFTGAERKKRLSEWTSAPSARESHPREEHLVPLFVVAGAAGDDAAEVSHEFNFGESVLGEGRGFRSSSFIFK